MRSNREKADRLSALVALLSLLTISFGWFLFYWHTAVVRESALARAHDTARSQSRILREHADQALVSASIALRSLDVDPGRAGIQPGFDRRTNHLLLRRLRDSSPLFEGIGLVNRDGEVSASAERDPPIPVNLADRDYFAFHRDNADEDLLIGAPIMTRPNNAWTIPLSRRIENDKGEFLGVIAARLRPDPFEQLYASSGSDMVLLYRNDGVILAQSGRQMPGRVEGSRVDIPRLDSPDSIVAVSASREFPISVAVGYDVDLVLAPVRAERDRLGMVAAGSTAMLILLTVLLVRRIHDQWRIGVRLEAALDSAEAANRSKSTFLAHMSHELRTPLNAIIGFSEVMSGEMFGPLANPKYVEYAGLIRKSGTHLLDIINNILDLAKVDAGRWKVEAENIHLADIAADLRNFTQDRAREQGVELRLDVPGDLPEMTTDRRMLLQILINLTTNAIKFTPKGGSVTVTARALKGATRIVVADTGIGMSASDLERALSPFGAAASDLARRHQGTGLGLSLSKRFVELLGGRMDIETAPAQGTRISIVLPSLFALASSDMTVPFPPVAGDA